MRLAIALSENPRTKPVIDGRVSVEGVQLVPSVLHPSEMFWRQLRYADFDVSEMSLSSLAIATEKGNRDWVGIPVFTMRKFFHTGIVVSRTANVHQPQDLKGRRVGVPEYQQTAAVWGRGVLEHEFGVKPSDIEWFMERDANRSHGHSTGFKAPSGIRLTVIPPHKSIDGMLESGELDACIHYIAATNLVDRSHTPVGTGNIRYLFDDRDGEAKRYYLKNRLFPINHTLVMRRSLYERYPWLTLNLYDSFLRATEVACQDCQLWLEPYFASGMIDSRLRNVVNKTPMPYGLRGAREVLETLMRYIAEQGLTKRRVALEELFAPNTLDL